MKVNCPHCEAAYEVQAKYLGKTGPCKHCRKSFTIEAEQAEPFAPEPVKVKPMTAPSVPWVKWAGVFVLVVVSGLCGYFIGAYRSDEEKAALKAMERQGKEASEQFRRVGSSLGASS